MTRVHLNRRSAQSGFTLLEVTAAIAAFLLVAAGYSMFYQRLITTRMVTKAINEMLFIGEAAQNFRVDNGTFPNESGNCAAAIAQLQTSQYLGGGGNTSPFGSQYVTDCTGGTFFTVTLNAPSANTAAEIAGGLPRSTVTANSVSSAFSLPGAVPGLQAYLRRSTDPAFPNANTMETDINMNGNDILSVANVTAATGAPLTITAPTGVVLPNGTDLEFGRGKLDDDQGGSLELGGDNNTAGSGTPYIDFHTTGGGTTDFNSRIIAPNATSLQMITSGQLIFTTPNANFSGNGTFAGNVTARDLVLTDLNNFQLSNTVQDVRVVENGNTVPKPTCPAGKTQGIALAAESMGEGATPSSFYGWQARAIDDPTNPTVRWQIVVQVFTGLGVRTPAANFGRLTSMTYCFT